MAIINLRGWEPLLDTVDETVMRLNHKIGGIARGNWAAGIALVMLHKGLNTFRAIRLLYAHDLPMESQALIRVLVEVRIDLEVFFRFSAKDPKLAVARVVDAMMLQKFKQQQQSDFRGHELVREAPSPDQQREVDRSLVERYGKELAARMRKHGFSGQPVEQRARDVGLSDLYNVVYRNFSRNVHGTDYAEYLRMLGLVGSSKTPDYEELRDNVALSTTITCVLQMGLLASSDFASILVDEFRTLFRNCHAFEHWVQIPTEADSTE